MDETRLKTMVRLIFEELGAEDAHVIDHPVFGRFRAAQSRAFPGEAVHKATAHWESQFRPGLDIDRNLYIVLTKDGRWTLTNSWGDPGREAVYRVRQLDMDQVEAALA